MRRFLKVTMGVGVVLLSVMTLGAIVGPQKTASVPAVVDEDLSNTTAFTPEFRQKVIERFNRNATEVNARLKANYRRRQEVCRNLQANGFANARNCPPPVPNYVEMQ